MIQAPRRLGAIIAAIVLLLCLPLRGGQTVKLLQCGVHHRSAHLRGRRRLRQSVNRTETVEQRALLEVGRPRR